MTNVILCGCGGRMGHAVTELINKNGDFQIVAGVDVNASSVAPACKFPVYQTIKDFPDRADVIIDFSHHSLVYDILAYSKEKSVPAIICTTGHTEE